jgi:hypothetical protein
MMFCLNDMWDESRVIADARRGNATWSQRPLLPSRKLNWMRERDKSTGVKLRPSPMEMSIVIIMLSSLRYF